MQNRKRIRNQFEAWNRCRKYHTIGFSEIHASTLQSENTYTRESQ